MMANMARRPIPSRNTSAESEGSPDASTRSGNPWPAQCCVPAFFAASVTALVTSGNTGDNCSTRCRLAEITGVTLSPEDSNPWNLPMSEDSNNWGVSAAKATATFPAVCAYIAPDSKLQFEIRPFNEIPFELYENEVLDFTRRGAMVGISFDNAALQSRMGREVPRRRGHHVVRLTPIGNEREREPNVLSDRFKFDYAGSLWVFDDTHELREQESFVEWRSLLYASRSVRGGLWIVRPEERENG